MNGDYVILFTLLLAAIVLTLPSSREGLCLCSGAQLPGSQLYKANANHCPQQFSGVV